MSIIFRNQIVTSGITLYLDSGNIRSYTNTSSQWVDMINEYNGTFLSGVTYNSSNGGSIVLDGVSYISINDNIELNRNVFTYTSWIKNTDNSLFWNRIASKKNQYTDNNGYEISLATNNSTDMYIGGSSSTFAVISTINWINTGWHYLVVMFSGTTVTVYVDTIYKGQGNIASIVSNTNPLLIGKIYSEPTTQWIGNITNVIMYNRNLNTS